MKHLPSATLVLLFAATAFSGARGPETASRFVDAANGYSIEPPAFPKAPAGTACQTAAFLAPPEGGFAPNVNIQIQGNATSLEEFITASRAQFKEYGLNLLSEEKRKVSGKEAVAFDYEGDVQGTPLRFAALAVGVGGRVILVTATTPKESFGTHEKAIRACLGSLQLEKP
jgi:hypothetical protein